MHARAPARATSCPPATPSPTGAISRKAGRDGRRSHRQHQLGRRPHGLDRPGQLRRGQGGHRRAHHPAGRRVGPLRRARQRHRTRCAHPHDRRCVRRHGRTRAEGEFDVKDPANASPLVVWLGSAALRRDRPCVRDRRWRSTCATVGSTATSVDIGRSYEAAEVGAAVHESDRRRRRSPAPVYGAASHSSGERDT